jgi:hypothetical protein
VVVILAVFLAAVDVALSWVVDRVLDGVSAKPGLVQKPGSGTTGVMA